MEHTTKFMTHTLTVNASAVDAIAGNAKRSSKLQANAALRPNLIPWPSTITKENPVFDTLKRSEYKVVSVGALASAVRPRIERSIEQALNGDVQSTREARFPRQVKTRKTRIA